MAKIVLYIHHDGVPIIELERVRVIDAPGITHLRFRIRR
jgi:hypothetical protein